MFPPPTPDVEYTYKTTAPGLGSLIKVESSVSTTEYTSFDILGRVTGHKQTTDGAEYSTGDVYNLSGALVEQTYPSGRVVKNVIDGNGDLSIVQGRKNASHGYWNYAKSFTYNVAGAVTSMQLGNGYTIWTRGMASLDQTVLDALISDQYGVTPVSQGPRRLS